jgi:hypothetical protein
MRAKRFTDPLGSKLPALEQNILKYRAMEMLLVMFYAEELKRDVLNRIETTDRMRRLHSEDALERVPKGANNAVDKALSALVTDRAITAADKIEIVKLIDYRNVIGHQMHNLLLDVSPESIARDMVTSDRLPKYNYKAVARLRHFLDLFGGLYRTHHYIMEVNLDRLLFKAAEKTFLAEINRLGRKISKLANVRQAEIKKLNTELPPDGTEFPADWDPQDPLNQYDDGRLTQRGVCIQKRLQAHHPSPLSYDDFDTIVTAIRRGQRLPPSARPPQGRVEKPLGVPRCLQLVVDLRASEAEVLLAPTGTHADLFVIAVVLRPVLVRPQRKPPRIKMGSIESKCF